MVVFNLVNQELGTIPSRTIKLFKNRILSLSNPGQGLNANNSQIVSFYILLKK